MEREGKGGSAQKLGEKKKKKKTRQELAAWKANAAFQVTRPGPFPC